MGPQSATSPTGSEYRHEGEHCFLWPYARGHFSRDFLYHLWTLIEADHDWPKVFWMYGASDDTPVSQWGDLIEWIHYIQNVMDPKALLMVQDKLSKEIAGLIWFYNQKPESAHGGIWISKKYRGTPLSRDALDLAYNYGFYARGWKTIFGVTPWAIARNLLKRSGMSDLATVPEWLGPTVYLLSIKETEYVKISAKS